MKYGIVLLLLCACSPLQYATRATIESEESRVVSYYQLRSTEEPFSTEFYNTCDSMNAFAPAGDKHSYEILYGEIASDRVNDSLGAISSQRLFDLSAQYSNQFLFLKGGRK